MTPRRSWLAAASAIAACATRDPAPLPGTPAEPPPPIAPSASVAPVTTPPATAATASPSPVAPSGPMQSVGPGFPDSGPWVAFYGNAAQMGDLARVARTYRIIDVDLDPTTDGRGNFTDAQIRTLQAGGKNRVLSYLDLGSCERFRSYWSSVPEGLVSCGANRAAQLGVYEGYPDEVWMDPGNADYQRLILDYVAKRIAARGADGFYLDNLEVAEHDDADDANSRRSGWCSPTCRQGALDLVRKLRERFPDLLLVMQNATSDVTRLGTTGGVPFPTLLDGVAHEEVYAPSHDAEAEAQLALWQALGIRSRRGDRPFFIGTEDYVGSCANAAQARAAFARSRSHGFSPCATDASGAQKVVCYWAP